MGDCTHPQVERFSTRQTLRPVKTGSRCRRNHFSEGGNTKSKSLFCCGEQPWQEQFCKIHRHGQKGVSLVSLIELCIAGDMSPLLTVDPGTTTVPTPRLTQRYQMTTTSPLSPAGRSSLCSHQVSNRLVPLLLPSHSMWSVSSWGWLFRMTSQTGFVPRSPVSSFGLELENILEDHGVSSQAIDEMLALEWETCRRCFPAQPALSALQRYN